MKIKHALQSLYQELDCPKVTSAKTPELQDPPLHPLFLFAFIEFKLMQEKKFSTLSFLATAALLSGRSDGILMTTCVCERDFGRVCLGFFSPLQ